jgi:CRP-like cAMP-binding protein
MEAFKSYLKTHLHVSDADWEIIKPRLQEKTCAKFEQLTRQDRVEDTLYFIVDGVIRLFHEGENKDTTLNFAFPNEFISSYSSFLRQEKSEFILESLTDCSLIFLKRKDLYELYELTECGHELGRILTENFFIYLSKRESDFLLKSPTERYLDLFENQPHWVQEIPQKYLASYIGVTPQALSRIRAKLVKSN